jgi:hypothetical protein
MGAGSRGALRLADLLDADVCFLPGVRDVGTAGDLPLAGLVGQAVADLKLHRENPGLAGRRWRA